MENRNEKRRFCSACGAPLTGTPFCGECGAKVPTTTIQIPVIAEAEPVYVEEMAAATEPVPVVVAPAVEIASEPEPVVIPETVVQISSRPWRFPVASVILVSVATLWFVIQLFANPNVTVFTGLYAGCTATILLGMILCKKKRDWITGIAFVAYACAVLACIILSVINYRRAGADVFTTAVGQIFSATNMVCYGTFGISYLVAKSKLFVLKIVSSVAMMGMALFGCLCMVVAAITTAEYTAYVWGFLGFLVNTIPLGLSVILYTPFKKR